MTEMLKSAWEGLNAFRVWASLPVAQKQKYTRRKTKTDLFINFLSLHEHRCCLLIGLHSEGKFQFLSGMQAAVTKELRFFVRPRKASIPLSRVVVFPKKISPEPLILPDLLESRTTTERLQIGVLDAAVGDNLSAYIIGLHLQSKRLRLVRFLAE